MQIRPCSDEQFDTILEVIQDGARAYRGVIPADRLNEPYMDAAELRHELKAGIRFYAAAEGPRVLGVMGVQEVEDITLIRHAYVRTASQGLGAGSMLLTHLRGQSERPMLMGAWSDAAWAIRFYQRHGFRLVGPATKVRLLRRYWTVPERQIETSVVLADERWWSTEPTGTS